MFKGFDEDGKMLLSKDYLFVAHFWFQGVAVCIALPPEDVNINIKQVKRNLRKRGIESKSYKKVDKTSEDYYPQITRPFTKERDTLKFLNEIQSDDYVRNIITTKVTKKDIINDLCCTDFWENSLK